MTGSEREGNGLVGFFEGRGGACVLGFEEMGEEKRKEERWVDGFGFKDEEE